MILLALSGPGPLSLDGLLGISTIWTQDAGWIALAAAVVMALLNLAVRVLRINQLPKANRRVPARGAAKSRRVAWVHNKNCRPSDEQDRKHDRDRGSQGFAHQSRSCALPRRGLYQGRPSRVLSSRVSVDSPVPQAKTAELRALPWRHRQTWIF